MGKSFSHELAEWMAKVDKQLSNLSSGNRLDHASLDGTTLYLRDADGNLSGRLGRQPDGSNGVHVVRVQPPPQLTAAILTAGGMAGSCQVKWDGGTFDGRRMPLIHGHTEIWAAFVGDEWVPTVAPPESATRVGSIRDRTGGEAIVALPQTGVWAVWLRAMGADRETAGPWSPVSTIEMSWVDTEYIENVLEVERERVDQAVAQLAAGQEQLDTQLDYLNNERLPALDSTLSNLTAAVDDYDQRIDAAQAGADQANATADHLEGTVLPALDGRLTDNEQALEAAEGTLSETRLGMENLRDVRLPSLEDTLASGLSDANEWREVGAISASSLRVGNWDNRIVDTRFEEVRLGDNPFWRPATSGSYTSASLQRAANGRALVVDPAYRDGVSRSIFYGLSGEGIPVTSGDTWRVSFKKWQASASAVSDFRLRLHHIRGDGSAFFSDTRQLTQGAVDTQLHESFEVPADVVATRPVWNVGATASTGIYDVSMTLMADASMIVDGAISARHIMAQSIAAAVGEFLELTADQIDTENLAAHLATIIELDAGQITSGKINTSRLDAEEVAGAVANFLTLDALEINVEELAGQIANIIEITADSIAARAISTRHLAIGDTDNLMPQQAIEDLAAHGDNQSPWNRLRGATNRWTTITGQGRGMRAVRINDGTSSSSRATMEYRAGGQGIPVGPGDSLRLSFYGWAGGSGAAPSISLVLRAGDGTFITRADSASARSGWNDYALEVHNSGSSERYLVVEFDVPAGVAMRGHWQDFRLRHMTGGELLVDGAVKSRSVDTEEFFAAQAVIEKIWTNIVRAKMIETQGFITEDMIATGAITTPKLTVTEEMVAEVVKVMRLEGDEMDFNVIRGMIIQAAQIEGSVFLAEDAEGNQTIRLDGMDNYLAGTLHAGINESTGITLDYGENVLNVGQDDSGEPVETTTWTAPYMIFESDHDHASRPRITVDEHNGGLRIFPGKLPSTPDFRGRLSVAGDVRANRTIGNSSRMDSGLWLTGSDPEDVIGGLDTSGGALRLIGQFAGISSSRQTIVRGFYGGTERTVSSGGTFKTSTTYGVPAESGNRWPVVSTNIGPNTYDQNRMVMTVTQGRTASGHNTMTRQSANNDGGSASYSMTYLAIWD